MFIRTNQVNLVKARIMKNISIVLLLLLSLIANSQDLKVAKIFNDHAVLQRDVPLPIWGWAKPGERIWVTFLDKTYKTKTAKTSKWETTLPANPYGGPYTLEIKSAKSKKVFTDIYIGDVWVCSGQSNMEFQLSSSFVGEFNLDEFTDPLIRHFRVTQSTTNYPSDELVGGGWNVGGDKAVTSFTAVGYYFAKYIRKEFPGISIGLVNNSWGGAKIEPFMNAASLGKSVEEMNEFVEKKEKEAHKEDLKLLSYLKEIPFEDAGMKDGIALWAKSDLDDSDWEQMKLPNRWEKTVLPHVDGTVWFRKEFSLNKIDPKQSTLINLGRIDDIGEIWLNEKRIDTMANRTFGYSDLREYTLSNTLFKKGKNTFTIRATDMGGGGGVAGAENEMFVDTGFEKINLASEWKFKIGKVQLNHGYGPLIKPTGIYNKMIYPITNYKIKGAIWYQGESNTDDIEMAQNYEKQFKRLIEQWRSDWKQPEMPFYFVQLASLRPEPIEPTDHNWAHLRQSQFNTLELPHTGMASAIDLGEVDDIHPKNKKDVGKRLALIALNQIYGKSEIEFKNPSYKSHTIENDAFLITFKDFGEKLTANKYGHANGFAIAGEDGVFKWANATIKNNVVKVWHSDIKNPKAIRYAWHSNALDANLYSENGLPVVPFKID